MIAGAFGIGIETRMYPVTSGLLRQGKLLWQKLTTFAGDLLDRRAGHRQMNGRWVDLPAVILPGIASASAFLDQWKRIVTDSLGVPGALGCVILCATGVAWSIYVISASEWNNTKRFYKFAFVVRQLSKAALFIMMFLFPSMVVRAVDDMRPLPGTIYGEIRDLSNKPVPNVSVRVVDSGEDVTGSGSLATDRPDGFYVVQTTRRVRRAAKLAVGCSQGTIELSLERRYQVKPTRHDLAPSDLFFRHFIRCESPK